MIILGTNSIKDTGYDVANSLRFNDGSSDYLNRTLGSDGNRKKWTWSGWVKRSGFVASQMIFGSKSGNISASLNFRDDQLRFLDYDDGTFGSQLKTNRLFRDVSAWYHIVVAYDTTQGTESNRIKFYVNGVQETSFATSTYPSVNFNGYINESDYTHYVGSEDGSQNFFDGYMAEVCFINDQQLDATSFGEFDEDSGIWKPIDVSGLTFGTNGFYLEFKQSGTSQNSSGLGADTSGNDNHFAVNNLTAVDQSTDTCTNNFATLNPLNVPASNQPTFSEGNLKVNPNTSTGAFRFGGASTIGVSSGKWYIESKATVGTTSRNEIGVTGEPSNLARQNYGLSQGTNSSVYYKSENGNAGINESDSYTGSTYTTGDIIGVALDMDNLKVYFSKNGTWQNSGNPESGATGTGAISLIALSSTLEGSYFFMSSDNTNLSVDAIFEFNFGSPPYSISSGNTDGNGYGNFEYAVPSGYYALNTKNLAEYG
jgi:hypothetical protein